MYQYMQIGWMMVIGLAAVEIEFKSDSKFRIGTDDPDELLNAIRVHSMRRVTRNGER